MKTLKVKGPAKIKFYRTTEKEDGTSGAILIGTQTVNDGYEFELKCENHNMADHLVINDEESYIFDYNGFELI